MENHSEKIQDYIEGQLVGDELLQFEAQLIVDDELRNLLALQKDVHDILVRRVMSKDMELRGTLSDAENNFRHDPNAKVINIKRIITVLVAACALFIASLFFFNQDNELYELPIMPSEVVRGQEENIAYERAVNAFNAKDYGIARDELTSLLKAEPNQLQYQYYIGLTFIGESKWSDAIANLGPMARGESVFAKDAMYYLALAYYKNHDTKNAKILLEQIVSENGTLGVKAQGLLDEIN